MMVLLPVMVAAAFLVATAGFCWATREPRPERVSLARLADPAPLPWERAPFPADTGPLILWSEQAAALSAHEREVRYLCEQAEWRIGRVAR